MNEYNPSPDEDIENDAIIGIALRWSLFGLIVIAAIGIPSWLYFAEQPRPPELRQTQIERAQSRLMPELEIPSVPFMDITSAAGINFQHENGAIGEKLLPETMGGGCAFLDFNNDGHQDILLVNSCYWPWDEQHQTAQPTMALYQNDGRGNFADVTAGSGLDVSFYGMGVAIADYDRDGDVDIYITAVGPNHLFENLGEGKFQEVTESAGVGGKENDWGTSCGWFDYDRDGDLDLFVCNYVEWSKDFDAAQNFQLTGGGRAYGRPQNFQGVYASLYRNDGNKSFTDVSAEAGIHVNNPATGVPMAKSLGVTFDDFDGDGWLDIVVSNDTVQNHFFHNQQNGTFLESGALVGIAFDPSGNARGAMGLDTAHFRNDEAVGVAIGNFSNEMTALYVAYGNEMLFTDEAIASGLGPNTRLELTFGVFYFDYDLDGRVDLFAANGHLEEEINRVQPSQHYEQSPQLFWNCGPEFGTEFVPMSEEFTGKDFSKPLVGRGASYADIDHDGDLDVLIAAVGGRPRLLRNDQTLQHNWLRFKLVGTVDNLDAIGAIVKVQLSQQTLVQQLMPTCSYLSQVELPLTFGLGDTETIEQVTIIWPNSQQQNVKVDELNQEITVQQERK